MSYYSLFVKVFNQPRAKLQMSRVKSQRVALQPAAFCVVMENRLCVFSVYSSSRQAHRVDQRILGGLHEIIFSQLSFASPREVVIELTIGRPGKNYWKWRRIEEVMQHFWAHTFASHLYYIDSFDDRRRSWAVENWVHLHHSIYTAQPKLITNFFFGVSSRRSGSVSFSFRSLPLFFLSL